jgi:ribose transport system permease protein
VRPARGALAALSQRYGALVALLVAAALATVRHEAFLTPENVLNILRQNAMLGITALGMTFVIVHGGIDLSVGALVAAGGVVAAAASRWGSGVAVLAAAGATATLGLANGLVIVRGRVQPFIATLGMMFAVRGATLAWTHETSVCIDPRARGLLWLGRGLAGPIPAPVVLLFVAYAAGWIVLARTRFGRHVYAVGDNADAARLMGLDVGAVRLRVYVQSGLLAGFAGALLASRLGAAQPVAGVGWELDAIASVVVGGSAIASGQGNAGATLSGVLLLGVLFNVINLEGTISPFWQSVMRGVFLLAVIVIQNRLSAAALGRTAQPARGARA